MTPWPVGARLPEAIQEWISTPIGSLARTDIVAAMAAARYDPRHTGVLHYLAALLKMYDSTLQIDTTRIIETSGFVATPVTVAVATPVDIMRPADGRVAVISAISAVNNSVAAESISLLLTDGTDTMTLLTATEVASGGDDNLFRGALVLSRDMWLQALITTFTIDETFDCTVAGFYCG